MNVKLPWSWMILGVVVLWLMIGLRPPAQRTDFDLQALGRLPVSHNGRIQPLDSVARNTLLMIRGSQSVPLLLDDDDLEDGVRKSERMTATEWWLETACRPDLADRRFIFRIHHPEVIRDLGLTGKGIHKSGLYWFSYQTMNTSPQGLEGLTEQADRIQEIDPKIRTTAERQIAELFRSITLYRGLKNCIQPENAQQFDQEIQSYGARIPASLRALQKRESAQDYDEAAYQALMDDVHRFDALNARGLPLLIPPENPNLSREHWLTMGQALLSALQTGTVPQAALDYATLGASCRQQEPERFNQTIASYTQRLAGIFPHATQQAQLESLFNDLDPFYRSTCLYVLALLIACFYWLRPSAACRRTALILVLLALVIHTTGLLCRMVLMGRPPVTNLYSSAIFIGWGAVVLGVVLERWHKNGIGLVMACMIGFITLRIAQALSLDGDTMAMLQAVLDTNAWLATHVVVITLGYAATFVAGFLGLLYILLGAFTPILNADQGKSLVRMVYGTLCFAMLLSFVGTILGGIWADQSWGRFWGWDPKENGALLIVLWNALILHARWGGMIRARGLMAMAVFGNVVTAFSWFGVNLLEIGLHSYGFREGSFTWLVAFALCQGIVISVGCFFPQKYWRLHHVASSAG